MTQFIEDVLPPIQSAGLNTAKNVSITGTLASGAQTVTGAMAATGATSVLTGTAVPATAAAVPALTMFSSGPSIYVTSNAPTHTAVKGSLCINTGGSSTSTRLYVNTDGATTWTNFTSAA